jgi:hypothetical protein
MGDPDAKKASVPPAGGGASQITPRDRTTAPTTGVQEVRSFMDQLRAGVPTQQPTPQQTPVPQQQGNLLPVGSVVPKIETRQLPNGSDAAPVKTSVTIVTNAGHRETWLKIADKQWYLETRDSETKPYQWPSVTGAVTTAPDPEGTGDPGMPEVSIVPTAPAPSSTPRATPPEPEPTAAAPEQSLAPVNTPPLNPAAPQTRETALAKRKRLEAENKAFADAQRWNAWNKRQTAYYNDVGPQASGRYTQLGGYYNSNVAFDKDGNEMAYYPDQGKWLKTGRTQAGIKEHAMNMKTRQMRQMPSVPGSYYSADYKVPTVDPNIGSETLEPWWS